MASEYFKRMRGEALRQRGASTTPSAAPEDNPWSDSQPSRLADLAGTSGATDERSAAYADWAQRMQDKRAATKARIAAETSVATTENPSGTSATYWTTDALFAESERVAHEELIERPNPWRVHELLALLHLRHDATPQEISDAYKHLAKAHHPDRYVMADEATQQFHADKMTDINKAYRALRQLERV